MEVTKWLKPSGREAPPDERGGNRQAEPTVSATHPYSTIFDRIALVPVRRVLGAKRA